MGLIVSRLSHFNKSSLQKSTPRSIKSRRRFYSTQKKKSNSSKKLS